MDIRPARSADADTLKALDEVARTDAVRQAYIDHAIALDQCWVAARDGVPVAYAVLTYTFFHHGWIDMLYVERAARRSGVGSALLTHLAQRCATPKLFTSTNRSNTPMQALLVKAGYQPSGVVENLDEGDPELVYMKRLRSA